MTVDPFGVQDISALGTQMAQAWKSVLDSWWRAMMADSDRLRELSDRLGALGGSSAGGGQSGTQDLSQVLSALELMEKRVQAVEGQVKELAEGLAFVLSHLDKRTEG